MSKRALETSEDRWGVRDDKNDNIDEENGKKKLKPGEEKQKANFGLSGALNRDARSGKVYNGVVLKWSEPSDAATPQGPGWRLYIFDGDNLLETISLHRQSAHLVSRDSKIADIMIHDDSVSKQHAVIQFRIKTKMPPPGSLEKPKHFIRPYLMDLESRKGTRLNGNKIESSRYIELLEKDIIRFGKCRREYVVMYAKESTK